MEQRPFSSHQERCWGAYCATGTAEANAEEENDDDDDEGKEEEEAHVIPKPRKLKRTTTKPDRKEKAIASTQRSPRRKRWYPRSTKYPRGREKSLLSLYWLLRK